MYQTTDPKTEVTFRQKQIRAGYIQAQRQISVGGLRQILGNTVIEIGGKIHGMTQVPCMEAAQARGRVRGVLRAPGADIQATRLH